MILNQQSLWAPRLAALLLAALAAGSAVYWGLQWSNRGDNAVPAALPMADAPPTDPISLARALGGGNPNVQPVLAAPVVTAASRMTLVGVVSTARQSGTALISLDGKTARPYRVGAKLDEGLFLKSVSARRADFASSADGPVNASIELPILLKK